MSSEPEALFAVHQYDKPEQLDKRATIFRES